jgi:hypothetical protein
MAEIVFTPYLPEHLVQLQLQNAQQILQPFLEQPGYAASLVVPELAWTGLVAGEVVGCAGILPQWPGRAYAWALLGGIAPAEWVRVTALVRRTCARAHQLGHRRIETGVRSGFLHGLRWAEACGFEMEGLMRSWGPDGSDHWLYARVR